MPLQRPSQLAWPYLNPNSPLYQGLVFAGLGPHPGGWDFHDCSPYRNNGRLTNMDPATDWVWVPELGRWALDFDGTNDLTTLPNTPFLDVSGGKTIALSFWLKWNSTICGFLSAKYNNYTNGVHWNVQKSDTQIRMHSGLGYGTYVTVDAVDGAWNHFFIDFDGTNAWRIYCNGVLKGTSTMTVWLTATGGAIGTGFVGGDTYFDSSFSDLLVWQPAISFPTALADPSNAMLAVGNTPLILTRRRLFPAAAVGGQPTMRRWGGIPHMTPGPVLAGRSW